MTITGSGSAKSAIRSNSLASASLIRMRSKSVAVIRSTSGLSSSMRLGLKAFMTRLLSLVCFGGSESRMESEWR